MKPWWQVMQMGRIMSEFDDDPNNGGGTDDDLDEPGTEDGDLDEHEGVPGENDSPEHEPSTRRSVPPPVAPVDPAAIARAVAEGLKGHLPSPRAYEMSDEEFRKMTDFFEVNPEMGKQLARILGQDIDDEKAAQLAKFFQTIVDGTVKHSLKTSSLMQGRLEKNLSDRVVGLEGRYAKQQTDNFLEGVQSKYPALRAYREVLPQVLNALKASGANPQTDAEAIKMVAKAARDHVRKYVPNFMTSENPGGPVRRAMAGSVTGNGASVGGFGAGGNKKSKAASLPWD